MLIAFGNPEDHIPMLTNIDQRALEFNSLSAFLARSRLEGVRGAVK
jgi:hypothetical protein